MRDAQSGRSIYVATPLPKRTLNTANELKAWPSEVAQLLSAKPPTWLVAL